MKAATHESNNAGILTWLESKISIPYKLATTVIAIITLIIGGYKFYNNQQLQAAKRAELDTSITATLNSIQKEISFLSVSQKQNLDLNKVYWWRSDSSGATIEVGKATLYLLKRPSEDLMGTKWLNWIPSEYHAEIIKEYNEAKIYKRDFKIVYHFLKGDGQYIKLQAIATYANGDWFGTLTIVE